MRGIDISNWQGGLDLANVARSNRLQFVFLKATEGTSFVDKYCNGWISAAKSAGLLFGFYHYARNNNPEAEAEHFVKHTKGYFKDGIPVADIEEQQSAAWVSRFVERVYKLTGVYPMIYCSASYCSTFKNSDVYKKCGLWIAGYPRPYTSFIDSKMPYNIAPWTNAAIWQFTADLKLSGWNGKLDGDIAYITPDQWNAYANGGPVKGKTHEQNIVAACKVICGQYGNGAERIKKLTADGYNASTVQSLVNAILKL